MYMYEYTDKIIKIARRRFVKVFNKYKAQLHIDELNVLNGSKAMYDELEEISEMLMIRIAKFYYRQFAVNNRTTIDKDWLLDMLEDYEPTVEYVYLHEVDRKRDRFAESILATKSKEKPFMTALRYWNDMFTQFAVLATDRAVMNAYKDNGTKKVKWFTVEDERTCAKCGKLHGKVFDIKKVPPKPHWRCRCWLVPVVKG